MIAHRCALTGLLLIAAAASAAAQDAAPLPAIQITLPPAHARWRDTVTTVAHEAASIARDWFGVVLGAVWVGYMAVALIATIAGR